jgi:hypothetical protein
MILKSNDKVTVHQGYGYISTGKFIGVKSVDGMGYCYIIRVKSKNDEGCNMGGDIMIPISDFKHGEGEFVLRKRGYKDWLKQIKEKVTKGSLYNKWNTTLKQPKKDKL